MPYHYVSKLLPFLQRFMSRNMSVERSSRCLFFLMRCDAATGALPGGPLPGGAHLSVFFTPFSAKGYTTTRFSRIGRWLAFSTRCERWRQNPSKQSASRAAGVAMRSGLTNGTPSYANTPPLLAFQRDRKHRVGFNMAGLRFLQRQLDEVSVERVAGFAPGLLLRFVFSRVTFLPPDSWQSGVMLDAPENAEPVAKKTKTVKS